MYPPLAGSIYDVWLEQLYTYVVVSVLRSSRPPFLDFLVGGFLG